MKRFFSAAAILLLVTGCDSGSDSSGDDTRKFSVRYEASGTFTQPCNFVYIGRRLDTSPDDVDETGQGFNTSGTLPWSHAFDVTVSEIYPFNLYISAICGGGAATDMVEVRLFVDGVLRDSASETDEVANPEAELQISVND